MRDTMIVAMLFLCGYCVSGAQEPAKAQKAKEATGGVTGHVLCADTNLPARLASVLLQSAYEAVPVKPRQKPGEEASEDDEPRPLMVSIAQTSVDGSYSISGVSPGKYYVIVEKIGYLSPLSQLTREQLNKPDDAAQALIDDLLVPGRWRRTTSRKRMCGYSGAERSPVPCGLTTAARTVVAAFR